MKLSSAAEEVLQHYIERDVREQELIKQLSPEEGFARRDEMLIPVGPEVGSLLHSLILARNAKTIIEVGTSYGFSTLYLADAARLTGGKVITYEIDARKQEYAREALTKAGLNNYVEWRCGDAPALLKELDEKVDFTLIDLWKELYIPVLDILYPKMAQGGLIAADNMTYPEFHLAAAKQYTDYVRSLPNIVDSQLIEMGCGIELSCYWSE